MQSSIRIVLFARHIIPQLSREVETTQESFSLTFRWGGEEGWWLAKYPEWQVEGYGSTKEEARKALCRTILMNARAILDAKGIHPILKIEEIEIAQKVMGHRDDLANLLQEAKQEAST